jgi:hypothetical protein
MSEIVEKFYHETPYPMCTYYFDDGIRVELWLELMVFVVYKNDGIVVCSGTYELNRECDTVIDYDGVFDMPFVVCQALRDYGYKVVL